MTSLDTLDHIERKTTTCLHHALQHQHRDHRYWEGQIDALREVICDINDLRLKLAGLKVSIEDRDYE